jgi:hypothetical protein
MSIPHRRQWLPTLFDSGALITAAKFQARGILVIDHLLGCCRISTLLAVKQETVDAGLRSGYPDAAELGQRVAAGQIRILPSAVPDPLLEPLLLDLGLQGTDRMLMHAARAGRRGTWLVTDDHRLWVTASRLGLRTVFLPDLILLVSQRGYLAEGVAGDLLGAVRPRYASGFVDLAEKRLEGVI